MQQINFTGNLSGNNNRLIFFIIEEVTENVRFFTRNYESVGILFCFNIISI